jgi:fermentation-respiration switch protein FrsA (DUF1100 family)
LSNFRVSVKWAKSEALFQQVKLPFLGKEALSHGIRRISSMPLQWFHWAILIPLVIAVFYLFYPRIENFLVFFPDRRFDFTPEAFGLVYKDVYFMSGDGKKLHGWFFPGDKEHPVLLHFHGNAGNISHRLDLIKRLVRKGFQVFIIDYRGFGKSEGRPSEMGLYLDGLAAWDYLVEKEGIPPESIVLHGHSIGAAVVVEVALKRSVKSVILESAFTSTRDMAKTMPLFFIFSSLVPSNYNNLDKVTRLSVPALIVHGDRDEIVPFSMGERLFAAAPEPKHFLRLEGAGHNDTYVVGGKRYLDVLERFATESER